LTLNISVHLALFRRCVISSSVPESSDFRMRLPVITIFLKKRCSENVTVMPVSKLYIFRQMLCWREKNGTGICLVFSAHLWDCTQAYRCYTLR
jgi:hypothetical protein